MFKIQVKTIYQNFLGVYERQLLRSGANPHQFPPFYGNRSDIFIRNIHLFFNKSRFPSRNLENGLNNYFF